MGALDSQDECLSSLDINYQNAHTDNDNARAYGFSAYEHWEHSETLPAIEDLTWGVIYLHYAVASLIYRTDGNDRYADILYYLENYAGGELTWKTICEAWVKDDFEGRRWTIACIDHMRKLMWDEPFTIQWAAKPEAEST